MIAEIGKTYNHFDDGKICENRRYSVKITEIIPSNEIDVETLAIWKEEVEGHKNLYSQETDFFVKGLLEIPAFGSYPAEVDEVTYVRTVDNGWFSLETKNIDRLDITGHLTIISNLK